MDSVQDAYVMRSIVGTVKSGELGSFGVCYS